MMLLRIAKVSLAAYEVGVSMRVKGLDWGEQLTREPPYPFDYPMRRLTIEEILAKFIDEGRREHEEMEIFNKEFRTTNELLLKTRSNLLSELKIEVNELSKVVSNVLIPKNEVKGVTNRGGKMAFEATHSKKINETGINKNEPPRFEQDVQEKPHDDCVENKSSSIRERTTQPLNLKQLDINIPFIEALVQIPKYAKYLKSLLTNKSRLEEACIETMNERCSTVFLNEIPSKEKDPRSFTTPCQVFEKPKEAEALAANHLSRFQKPHMEVLTEMEIADKFFDKHLMVLKSKFNNDEPWYADFVNYIVGMVVPPNWTFEKRKRFFSQVKTDFWEEPYAFKLCVENIMRRCVAGSETLKILAHCHWGPTGGHHSANVTAKKVYKSGFYWPSVFKDANEHVRRCDACQILGNISSRNKMPQNNIQISGVNILKVGQKLNDALWAFRTAYKTPTGCTPFRLVYGKACHLPVEIEHKAHWALKQCNMDLTLASKSRLMQLNELAELRDGAYENTRIYKERTKKWHDSRLCGDKDFKVGDQVLLYNSRMKMYPRKLKSKWSGPNIIKTAYPHGAIEITDKDGFSFKVNGQRLKKYYGGKIDKDDNEVIEFENVIMEYLVNISKRRAFWSLNEDILKINDSDNQYAISIKEDTAYPCLHSPKTTKETSSIRRIQRSSIRYIQDIVREDS
ncbi:reverse transcriptase domain-containing protein [Tanacetum coccineum]